MESYEKFVLQVIRRYAKEKFKPLEPEQLKQEFERLQRHLSKESAGRVCWQSREDRADLEAAYKEIDRYYKDMKEWNTLFKPRIRKSPADK